MNPWICPRCHRVYGPQTPECGVCNLEIYRNENKTESPSISVKDFTEKVFNSVYGTNTIIFHCERCYSVVETKDIKSHQCKVKGL